MLARFFKFCRAIATPFLDLFYYLRSGRNKDLSFDFSRLDPARETVLLVLPSAPRGGVTITGYRIALHLQQKYNVAVLFLSAGVLVEDFRSCCAAVLGPLHRRTRRYPAKMSRMVQTILDSCKISYAIVNGIGGRHMLAPLNLASVPTVTLVHEFSSYIRPLIGRSVECSTQVVFPSDMVAAAACRDYPALARRTIHILPQGQCTPPSREKPPQEEEKIRLAMRPPDGANTFVVLGCGEVTGRKGADIFVACAIETAKLARRPIRFVWIGATPPDSDIRSALKRLKRAGSDKYVRMLGEVSDPGPAYSLVDAFFLSSRLDPLPNVCIDAALSGLPVICFENTTGLTDYLRRDPVTQKSIVSDLTALAAARVFAELAGDEQARKKLGDATRKMAERTFDMSRYVDEIDRLGLEAREIIRQRQISINSATRLRAE